MISALIALIVFGAILYLIQLIPMDATVKRVIMVVAIVIIVIWVIRNLLPMAGI